MVINKCVSTYIHCPKSDINYKYNNITITIIRMIILTFFIPSISIHLHILVSNSTILNYTAQTKTITSTLEGVLVRPVFPLTASNSVPSTREFVEHLVVERSVNVFTH